MRHTEIQPQLFGETANCSAVFSPDRRYRYQLWRRWDDGAYCCFIGLNPSTADEIEDDPTIRRCIGFAKDWGYGALCMLNLFAFRATNPAVMKCEKDPVGPDNDATLIRVTEDAGIVVAAWGALGSYRDRARNVIAKLPSLHHLGLTKDGHPRHPLYPRKETKPSPMLKR